MTYKEKSMTFSEFYDLIDIRFKTYKNTSGVIKAIRVDREEDLQTVLQFYSIAHGNCLDGPAQIRNSEWRGPDWYFCEHSDAYGDEYFVYLETLTEKKSKFEKFCAQFEEEKI